MDIPISAQGLAHDLLVKPGRIVLARLNAGRDELRADIVEAGTAFLGEAGQPSELADR